jgi:2-alkyl-3-oxoalkanoate reductase
MAAMRVFVAGATGAVGRRLVPRLVSAGYDVVGMTRSSEHESLIRSLGATPVVADALDRASVLRVVSGAKPDVVVHQLTALARMKNLKNFDTEFAVTNRLRTEGTDNLVAAARTAGAGTFIAQSYAGWTYEPDGQGPKTESSPFVVNPPAKQRQSLEAIRHLERSVTDASGCIGVVLRYANFYGPGTGFGPDGDIVKAVRKRQLPIVGNGAGVWSFIHIDDAATAVIAAMRAKKAGIYNIADDEPAAVAVWLPELARTLGAPAPPRVPAWLGRLFVGDVGVSMMTRIAGVANGKARQELGWQPIYASWREGFRADLAQT